MTLEATLNHRLPRGTRTVRSRGDETPRMPTRSVIEDPVARSIPGGVTQWLMPAAGITASVSRRAW
jgi:hypothetical protein